MCEPVPQVRSIRPCLKYFNPQLHPLLGFSELVLGIPRFPPEQIRDCAFSYCIDSIKGLLAFGANISLPLNDK